MAETLTFDPSSLGATPVEEFDPSSLGAVEDFDPSSLGAAPVEQREQTASHLAGLAMSGAAKGALQAATLGTLVGSKIGPLALFDTINQAMGLPKVSDELVMELGGAASRAEESYGVDPERKSGMLASLASGAGQLLPTLASGPLAPVTGGLMAGEQGRQEAMEAGGTTSQVVTSTALNALTGAITEKFLGLPALLKSAKAAKIPEKTFKALVGTIAKQSALSFGREGTQEVLEEVAQDTIAKYLAAYDPDRDVFDTQKLAQTFVVGGLLGAPVGGLAQTAVSLESVKEDALLETDQIASELQQVAQAEPEYAIQEPKTEQLYENVPPPEAREEVLPTEERSEGIREQEASEFVGTAIQTPSGIVTGESKGTAHPEMMGKAIDEGAEIETLENNLGFAFKKPDGSTEWVDRVEAGRRLTESGQLKGLKVGEKLTSEHIRGEVEGVTFTEPVTQDQAAQTLQPFFKQAVEAARQAGATDPESAASQAQIELSKQVSEGKTILDNPQSLFTEAARLQGRAQLQKESAQKRGGGIVPEPIETSGAKTDIGPRAETIAKESAQSVSEAISQMPENDRRVMEAMMDDPSLSVEDLATQTSLTVDQVKKARQNARSALKKFIRSEGIGERMLPGAASKREFKRARYIASSDIYEGLKSSGQLDRGTWEKNMARIYEDAFTEEDLNEAWAVAQQISEDRKKGQPIPKAVDEILGEPTGQGVTGIRNKQADIERRKRGLPAAMSAARRTHLSVWDEAMRLMDDDKQLQSNTVDKYRENPLDTPRDTENAILLHRQIELENQYDDAVDQINSAYEKGDENARLEAISRAKKAEAELIDILDINKAVGSSAGRSLSARKTNAGRDYTLVRMIAESRAAKGGEDITTEERAKIEKEFENIQRTQSDLRDRINQLEEEAARKAYEDSLSEMGTPEDPVVKSIVQRIVEKLNSAADKARKRIKDRALQFNAGIDPTVLYDVAVIGASKIANGLTKKSKWRTAMLEDLGQDLPDLSENLDQAWEESNRLVNQATETVEPKNREKIKKTLKGATAQEVIDTMESRMKERLSQGDSINDLRGYIQRIALELVRQGNATPDGLLDTVHAVVEPMAKGITKRQVMDLISGYGDSKALSKDAAMVHLRDLKGQFQQLAKLEDIVARKPLKKTGLERPIPSDQQRRLIKEVNEAKKKYGVVVTDPEKQLKSALDSVKTRIKNQIRDITHQIETGEKPASGTPPPSDSEVERLKGTLAQLRSTLKELEGKPEMTDEQRVRLTENSLERSIKSYEDQIKGETKEEKKQVTSPRIEALKAQRDALKAELDEIRAADQNLRDTQTFDRLMRSADELQAKLDRGDVSKPTKATRIENELVVQARERLQALRDQMNVMRNNTPLAQQERLEKAIRAVEASISSYDQKLRTGDLRAKEGVRVTSPVLERLRAERDAMRRLVTELRKPTPLSSEELALKALKSRLSRTTAEIQDRIARGDFSKKTRKELDISKDAEAVRLLAENERWKREFENRKLEFERSTESKARKAFRVGKEILNVPRAIKSSMDFSAVFRQGGFLAFGNPIRAAKNLKPMFEAAFSQKRFDEINAEIKSRPNAPLYKSSKLYLADLDGALDRREEAFRSELSDRIPGIKGSNRAYITFLNKMRADSFDAMVGSLTTTPTQDQLRAIAHFINISTGRGDLASHGSAAETLSTVLWSPRLLISRFQLLAGDPLLRGNAKGVRTAIAKEYAKALSGVAVVLALGALSGAEMEDDPRSSDFGKMKFGETRIDPWMGLQQVTVLLSRLITGTSKTLEGRIYDLTDYEQEDREIVDSDIGDVLLRFVRTKLTPLLGEAWTLRHGSNVIGEPVTPGSTVSGFVSPLSFEEIIPLLEDQGVPRGMAMELLNLFGMSVQVHQER